MSAGRGPAVITVERRVEWRDTDAAGHHHFTAILNWAEEAEYALHERLAIADVLAGRCPRVHVDFDYRRPTHARQVVEIDLAVLDVGRTSVRYAVTVRCEGESVADGVVAAVFVPNGAPTPWPEEVRRALLESGRVPDERYSSSRDGAA
jgi:2-aminobenzoate-CoA ligase